MTAGHCVRFEVCVVRGIECAMCGVCKVYRVRGVECARCIECEVLSVRDMECAKCRVWGVRNVEYAMCGCIVNIFCICYKSNEYILSTSYYL